MSQTDLEKRLEDRHIAYLYVNIYKEGGKGVFGLLADLSGDGFKLITDKHITEGREYQMLIKNPHSQPAYSLSQFAAKSIWCIEKEKGIFETGFEFVFVSELAQGLFVKLQHDFEATSYAINKLDNQSFDVEN